MRITRVEFDFDENGDTPDTLYNRFQQEVTNRQGGAGQIISVAGPDDESIQLSIDKFYDENFGWCISEIEFDILYYDKECSAVWMLDEVVD